MRDILKRNQLASSRNLRDPEACLLRNGFALCGYCGRKMALMWIHRGSTSGNYYYICNSRGKPDQCKGLSFGWRIEELDALAWDWYLTLLERPDILRAKYDLWLSTKATGRALEQDRLSVIDHLVPEYESIRQNNMRMAERETDDQQQAEYQLRAREAKKMVHSLTEEREKLLLVLENEDQQAVALEALVEAAPAALANARQADFQTKRRVLYYVGFGVKCYRRDHKPQYEIGCELDKVYNQSLEYAGISVHDHSR
ncbi:MAG: zinc ribbon domain-containing protein [Ktedonobacterales bacterium]